MIKKEKDIDDGSVVDTQTLEEKLGPDVIDSIANKEWKTAPLPTEEDLAKEKHKSPKARSNINSRKNLVQFNKNKKKETKEKIVKSLPVKTKRKDVDPFDYIEIPEDFSGSKITAFLPARKSLSSADEEVVFYTMINEFLHDFDLYELSASDIEDIISLALNRILESRLLSATPDDLEGLLDVSGTMERFRKHSDKLKTSLNSHRSARFDTKNKQNFSIVDIVYSYDDNKKEEYLAKVKKMDEENEAFKRKKGLV